jgi:hypothetical protein
MPRRKKSSSHYGFAVVGVFSLFIAIGVFIGLQVNNPVKEYIEDHVFEEEEEGEIFQPFRPSSEYSFILVIENDTDNIVDHYGGAYSCTNFTLSNNSYIFEFWFYFYNYTTFNETGIDGDNDIQYLWIDVRNNLTNPTKYDDGLGIMHREVKQINSDDIYNKWYKYELESPLFLENDSYYIILDLTGSEYPADPAEQIKWYYTSDATTGSNASNYYWAGSTQGWIEVAVDFMFQVNMSTQW